MYKTIGVLLGVGAIVILCLAATKPATFHVERSTMIASSPERIRPLLNDFHNWQLWSPWAHLDPQMREMYSGAAAGRGSIYEWQGNRKVGEGRMEILASESTLTSIRIDFLRPFRARDTSNFHLQSQGAGTRVTWTMDGRNTYMSKLVSVFVPTDRMIGKDFEDGLAQLKAVAER